MSPRTRAREVALQALFQEDVNPQPDRARVEAFTRRHLNGQADLLDFAAGLVGGTLDCRDEVDALLAGMADNWSLHRMAVADRNILRLGVYEILHADTPPRVAIDQAIELAKRFGTKQSPQFVNGILDRLLRDLPSAND